MEDEFVGNAVVDEEGNKDAEEYYCDASLLFGRLLEAKDLVQDKTYSKMHGEFVNCKN